MKFITNQESLSEAIAVVSKTIATNSPLPILSGILLTAQDDELSLQSTNLDVSVRYKIPAHIEEPGVIVVPARLFSNIVKSMPQAAIDFELVDNLLHITCQKSVFQLVTMAAQDFPDFPQYDLDETIELPVSVLSELVDRVKKSASHDKSRAILTGIYVTVENNTITLAATDSIRIAVADTHTETSSLQSKSFSLVIPSTMLVDVLSNAKTETVLIGSTDSQIVCMFGSTIYVARKIDGNFPRYEAVINMIEFSTTIKVSRDVLLDALQRVSVIAQSGSMIGLQVHAEQNFLSLVMNNPDQVFSKEEVDADIKGEDITIYFDYRFMLDGLSQFKEGEDIEIQLKEPLKPVIFKQAGSVNYLYFLAPLEP